MSDEPYLFNYTLKVTTPRQPVKPPEFYWQQGMASFTSHDIPYYLFKAASIKGPSHKIVFAEQRMFYEMTEAEFNAFLHPYPAKNAFTVSFWYWPLHGLTKRHSGKGNVTFADGHVQTVTTEFAQQPEHGDALY